MNLLALVAVTLVGVIVALYWYWARRRIAESLGSSLPAMPRRNLHGLVLAYGIVSSRENGVLVIGVGPEKHLEGRARLRGGAAVKMPDEIALTLASGEIPSYRLRAADLAFIIHVSEERIPDPDRDYSPEFVAWARRRYPEGATRDGDFNGDQLSRNFKESITIATVCQKYEQELGKKPYPLIPRITATVTYWDRRVQRNIGGFTASNEVIRRVLSSSEDFWTLLIETCLDGISMRSRGKITQVRCPQGIYRDIGRFIPSLASYRHNHDNRSSVSD